eukprot:1183676-Prorocentrum_minimum.AAC.2
MSCTRMMLGWSSMLRMCASLEIHRKLSCRWTCTIRIQPRTIDSAPHDGLAVQQPDKLRDSDWVAVVSKSALIRKHTTQDPYCATSSALFSYAGGLQNRTDTVGVLPLLPTGTKRASDKSQQEDGEGVRPLAECADDGVRFIEDCCQLHTQTTA